MATLLNGRYFCNFFLQTSNKFIKYQLIQAKRTMATGPVPIDSKGEFVKKDSAFRNFVTADGSSGYKAESGRYHLFVSKACPWAHRTLVGRALKGLEDCVSCTVVHWLLTPEKGWFFADPAENVPDCTSDTVNKCSTLKEVYRIHDKDYDGRVSVPVLWDKQTKTVVNNESAEILRMFNKEFNAFCRTDAQRALDFYPENLQAEIDGLNEWIYPCINNGVYRAGFAQKQEAYDSAVKDVFDGLDRTEAILSTKRYLTGNTITEADIRLFTTLVRFDQVYHGHFKCNKKFVKDYKNVWGYVRDLYQIPEVKATVNMFHVRQHYMVSHKHLNHFSIVSIGPEQNFDESHGREKLMK